MRRGLYSTRSLWAVWSVLSVRNLAVLVVSETCAASSCAAASQMAQPWLGGAVLSDSFAPQANQFEHGASALFYTACLGHVIALFYVFAPWHTMTWGDFVQLGRSFMYDTPPVPAHAAATSSLPPFEAAQRDHGLTNDSASAIRCVRPAPRICVS